MPKHFIYSTDEYDVRNYSTLFLGTIALTLLYSCIALLSLPLLWFEQAHPNANILNYADAFWALQMSASTIGFGDFYPVTQGGRAVVAAMFYIGVGIVGFIGAQIAGKLIGFADTNVRNRELRKQNEAILQHNIELEKKLDILIEKLEERS
ncbi:potassium channel family protein [Amphritea sp. HPY]|uniref:potassium channel family protein n=1 Tax=Amphritea sp. HPY TaxID=3421652 RepID=UPI003D7DAB3A